MQSFYQTEIAYYEFKMAGIFTQVLSSYDHDNLCVLYREELLAVLI